MDRYEHFSRVYDELATDYDDMLYIVNQAIAEHAPKARSLLEIGCGTGNILKYFSGRYDLAGIDISPSQLQVAKEKMPGVPFYHLSMADFNLKRSFDIVLCMYDAINHLPEYSNWQDTFHCVARHLSTGGLFIFDMNTPEKLDRLALLPPLVQTAGDNYVITDITEYEKGKTNWNIKVFQNIRDNLYEFGEDNVIEIAVPADTVKADLQAVFSDVQSVPSDAETAPDRVFFICKK